MAPLLDTYSFSWSAWNLIPYIQYRITTQSKSYHLIYSKHLRYCHLHTISSVSLYPWFTIKRIKWATTTGMEKTTQRSSTMMVGSSLINTPVVFLMLFPNQSTFSENSYISAKLDLKARSSQKAECSPVTQSWGMFRELTLHGTIYRGKGQRHHGEWRNRYKKPRGRYKECLGDQNAMTRNITLRGRQPWQII